MEVPSPSALIAVVGMWSVLSPHITWFNSIIQHSWFPPSSFKHLKNFLTFQNTWLSFCFIASSFLGSFTCSSFSPPPLNTGVSRGFNPSSSSLLACSPLVIPGRIIALSTMYMVLTSKYLSLPLASLSLLDCRVYIQHLHVDTQETSQIHCVWNWPQTPNPEIIPQAHSALSLLSFQLMFLQASICSHQNPVVFHASSFSLMPPHSICQKTLLVMLSNLYRNQSHSPFSFCCRWLVSLTSMLRQPLSKSLTSFKPGLKCHLLNKVFGLICNPNAAVFSFFDHTFHLFRYYMICFSLCC